jgi:cell division septum initiation protein DivIVA
LGDLESDNDAYDVELPRARVGGLKKDPVEKLLRRISDDFARLQLENERLAVANERLLASNEKLSAGIEHLDAGPAPAVEQAEPEPTREREDLALTVLALAQRAARELRESTRLECDHILRKVRSHALELELELDLERADVREEIEGLRDVRRALCESLTESLRDVLQTLLEDQPDEPRGSNREGQQTFAYSPGYES